MPTIKNKVSKLKPKLLLLSWLASAVVVFVPNFASAACSTSATPPSLKKDSSGKVVKDEGKTATNEEVENCLKDNKIIKDLILIINFLSAGVGIVVTASIIIASIQYIMAGNNANAVQAAKDRIQNALLALIGFLFLWSFLQWIIPGGIFSP